MSPSACDLDASALDAYQMTFQFGHEDNGMLLHIEDVQIAGSCSEIPLEVTVEFEYAFY